MKNMCPNSVGILITVYTHCIIILLYINLGMRCSVEGACARVVRVKHTNTIINSVKIYTALN